MKFVLLCGAAAIAALSVVPAQAQRDPNRSDYARDNGDWDRDAFWRGAQAGPRERITFLQDRIDRGVADGSLSRSEARRAQYELDSIRRDASRRRMTPQNREILLRRLDDLSRGLRWARANDRSQYSGAERDRFATDYDATRYYRDDPRYTERRLSSQDEVYRGSDGRYYCKRNDGTTGLIIGAAGGGVLGNVIDGGRNRVAGTLIGGALGALAGKAIDQNSDVRCR
jgi:hypothetical protein